MASAAIIPSTDTASVILSSICEHEQKTSVFESDIQPDSENFRMTLKNPSNAHRFLSELTNSRSHKKHKPALSEQPLPRPIPLRPTIPSPNSAFKSLSNSSHDESIPYQDLLRKYQDIKLENATISSYNTELQFRLGNTQKDLADANSTITSQNNKIKMMSIAISDLSHRANSPATKQITINKTPPKIISTTNYVLFDNEFVNKDFLIDTKGCSLLMKGLHCRECSLKPSPCIYKIIYGMCMYGDTCIFNHHHRIPSLKGVLTHTDKHTAVYKINLKTLPIKFTFSRHPMYYHIWEILCVTINGKPLDILPHSIIKKESSAIYNLLNYYHCLR